jgi:hypothetical protein
MHPLPVMRPVAPVGCMQPRAALARRASLAPDSSDLCRREWLDLDRLKMNLLSPDEARAARFAQEVLNADPARGPIEVRYIGAQQDVRDERFMIMLFDGERTFLFDYRKGTTAPVMLDVKVEGAERREALIDAAKAAATREKLSVIYFVQR